MISVVIYIVIKILLGGKNYHHIDHIDHIDKVLKRSLKITSKFEGLEFLGVYLSNSNVTEEGIEEGFTDIIEDMSQLKKLEIDLSNYKLTI